MTMEQPEGSPLGNEPVLFNFRDKPLRAIMIDGKPWFVGKDATDMLEFVDGPGAIRKHVLESQVRRGVRIDHPSSNSGYADVTLISESGLYRLIMRSNLPAALDFQAWVTDEVLPTLRETGGVYIVPGSQAEIDLTDPDTALSALAKAVAIAQNARADLEAEKIAHQETEQALNEALPLGKMALNLIIDTGRDWCVKDIALMLNRDTAIVNRVIQGRSRGMGETRLFDYLEKIGWIYKIGYGRERHWVPRQTQVTLGRMTTKPGRMYFDDTIQEDRQGNPQVRITGKGFYELHKRMRGDDPPSTLLSVV